MKNFLGGDMMKQVKQMRDQLKKAQKELKKETVTGSANGIVEVVMTGSQRCTAVYLEEEKFGSLSTDQQSGLILKATNDALEKSRKLMAEKLGPLSGGLGSLAGL